MNNKDELLIREIRDYLDENIYNEHAIPDLCRKFVINREKLQAGFQKLVQSTVHAYIIRQRMDRAARRLVESNDSIKAVALDSGYKKQRSFNKIFKLTFNLTPAEYRRLHRRPQNAILQGGNKNCL